MVRLKPDTNYAVTFKTKNEVSTKPRAFSTVAFTSTSTARPNEGKCEGGQGSEYSPITTTGPAACDLTDVLSVDWERDEWGRVARLDKVEVKARWMGGLEEICTNGLTLLHKNGTVDWQLINNSDRQEKHDGQATVFLWKVSNISPCQRNKFKLDLGGNIQFSVAKQLYRPIRMFYFSFFLFLPFFDHISQKKHTN